MFSTIGSKMKNLFTNNIIKENKKIEASMIQISLYEQIKSNEAAVVVKEYIPHFANFNFDVSEAIDIIVELSQKYNYEKEKVSFFIALLNSNMFTIKNKILTKITEIDYKDSFMNKEFKKYLSMNDHSLTTIAHSLKYLDIKNYYNILQTNKNYNRKLSRIVYKNVLFKYHNMDMKLRIKIWKSLLRVVNLILKNRMK